jgi:hypothetical protein
MQDVITELKYATIRQQKWTAHNYENIFSPI